MITRHLHVLLFMAILSVAGCKSNTEVSNQEMNAQDSANSNGDTSVYPNLEGTRVSREELAALTEEWSNAHTMLHIADLPKYYAEEVVYYGKPVKRDELVALIKQDVSANPDKSHEINNVTVAVFPNNTTARVDFSRSSQNSNGVGVKNCYILFKKEGGAWKIGTESDLQADAERMQTISKPMSIKDITSCDKAAEAIFRSSMVSQGMLRAPNASYKMEYRPGDPENPNNRYWFWIFGQAMGVDHVDTYGRFQVDPQTGDLYQFDASRDLTTQVPADKSLQKYIKKYCGK